MKPLFNCLNKFLLFILALAMMASFGCKDCGSFDPTALNIPDAVINYGQLVRDEKVPIETIVYGQMMPGGGVSGGSLLGQFDKIVKDINDIRMLDPQSGDLTFCVDRLEQDIKVFDLNTKSPNALKDLAANMEPYVKTGGKLTVVITDCGRHVSAADKKIKYDELSAQLVKDFDKLYQGAAVSTLVLFQEGALENTSKISTARLGITRYLEGTSLYNNDVLLSAAKGKLLELKTKLSPIETYADAFTAPSNVAASFTVKANELSAFLPSFKADVIDAATGAGKAAVETLYNQLDDAVKKLAAIATDYTAAEAVIKSPTDAHVKLLLSQPKESSLGLFMLPTDAPTDINKLSKLLGGDDSQEVVIPADAASKPIVYALASQVASKVASQFDLKVDDVVGFNAHRLNEVKKELSLDDAQFKEFLTSFAQKTTHRFNQGEHHQYSNVFVVPADAIEGDVSGMIEAFRKAGRVIVITSRPTVEKTNKQFFRHESLTISEGLILVNAMLQKENIKDIDTIVRNVVKVAAAFNVLRIDTLPRLVEGILARKQSTVDEAVNGSLADMDVSRDYVINSGIGGDGLLQVARNVKLDRFYYLNKAKNINTDVLQKLLADNANQTAQSTKQNEINLLQSKIDAEKKKAKASLRAVKQAYDGKRQNLNDALDRIRQGLTSEKNTITAALDVIKTTANKCLVGNKINTNTFNERERQKLYKMNFLTANTGGKRMAGILGEPDLTKFNVSWVSCLIFTSGEHKNMLDQLDSARAQIGNYIATLNKEVFGCAQRSSTGLATCLKNSVGNFDEDRRRMINAVGGSTPLLSDMLSVPKLGMIPDKTSSFWKSDPKSGRRLLVFSSGADSLGYYLSRGDTFMGLAHKLLNRQYYLKSFLNISGSDYGSFEFTQGGFDKPIPEIRNLDTSTGGGQKYRFLKLLLENFDDNNALMVKALRVVNEEYQYFVAYSLANIMYKKVAKKLYDEVIEPFFNLDFDELKLFQEAGTAGSDVAKRKDIWTKMSGLNATLNNLAAKLQKPLIAPGDGNTVTGNLAISGLYELGDIYDKLDDKIYELHVSLSLVQSMPDINKDLKNNIEAIYNNAYALIENMDTNNKYHPWSSAPAYAAALSDIGKEFMAAFYDAYDLHKFNYFNMDFKPLVGDPAPQDRYYPNWHTKFLVNNESPYNINNVEADAKKAAKSHFSALTDGEFNLIYVACLNEVGTNANSTFQSAYEAALAAVPAGIVNMADADKKRIADAIARIVFPRAKYRPAMGGGGNFIRHPLEE